MYVGMGGDEEAPPPDIASGGYERRAAFELWELEAATLVAGSKRPSAKYTIFAPGRHSSKATEPQQSGGRSPLALLLGLGSRSGTKKGRI